MANWDAQCRGSIEVFREHVNLEEQTIRRPKAFHLGPMGPET